MFQKRAEFTISRCNSDTNECKSKEEIDNFISDLVVEIWAVYETIAIK